MNRMKERYQKDIVAGVDERILTGQYHAGSTGQQGDRQHWHG